MFIPGLLFFFESLLKNVAMTKRGEGVEEEGEEEEGGDTLMGVGTL